MAGHLVINGFEKILKWSWPNFKYYFSIYREETRKTMKILRRIAGI